MEAQHPGGWGWNITELRQELRQKADKHELFETSRAVASLVCAVRELRAEVAGLRHRLETLEEGLKR